MKRGSFKTNLFNCEADPLSDPDPRKEIKVDPDPDLDPEWGLNWIRIRPNAVDPGGSGSETLIIFKNKILKFL